MNDRHWKKHLEMERLFGVDFLPLGRGAPEATKGGLDALRNRVAACTKCAELCAGRTQTVFGVGPATAPLLFVGEAPGEEEDRQGEPFVGRAGRLLTDTLRKLGVQRDRVYIANILKCRPPGNRNPLPQEMADCMPFLEDQIRLLQPRLICCLGGVAAKALLETQTGITRIRGREHLHRGMRFLPTYHPAYVLRNMSALKTFEEDIAKACREAGILA